MTTKVLDIIDDALKEVNVISEVATASPEQGQFVLRRLNQMMALWAQTKDMDMGWFDQADTSGDMPTPDWVNLAIITGLAVAIAPKYGATISQELASIATSSISGVQTRLILDRKRGVDLSYLPVGAGHYGRGNSILTDS
jgi:hypothetical protein